VQEALAKIAAVRAAAPELPLLWHFIGPIQSTRPADRRALRLCPVGRPPEDRQRLSEQRPAHLPPLTVLLQVNISGEASKSGVKPEDLPSIAHEVAALPRLRLRGLMAIPEPNDDPVQQQLPLAAMKRLFDAQREAQRTAALPTGIPFQWDVGRSGGAIGQGATMVRIGHRTFRSKGKMKIAFIGGGNMAAALIGGLLRAGRLPADLSVVEIDTARCAHLRSSSG